MSTNGMPFVYRLVKEDLNLQDEFLLDRSEEIKKRLMDAAEEIVKENMKKLPDQPFRMRAIDQCLYLAISVLFMGSEIDKLENVKNTLKGMLDGLEIDPTDAAAVCVLWYLLRIFPDIVKKKKQEPEVDKFLEVAKKLAVKFDDVNWFLGEEAVKRLEFPPRT